MPFIDAGSSGGSSDWYTDPRRKPRSEAASYTTKSHSSPSLDRSFQSDIGSGSSRGTAIPRHRDPSLVPKSILKSREAYTDTRYFATAKDKHVTPLRPEWAARSNAIKSDPRPGVHFAPDESFPTHYKDKQSGHLTDERSGTCKQPHKLLTDNRGTYARAAIGWFKELDIDRVPVTAETTESRFPHIYEAMQEASQTSGTHWSEVPTAWSAQRQSVFADEVSEYLSSGYVNPDDLNGDMYNLPGIVCSGDLSAIACESKVRSKSGAAIWANLADAVDFMTGEIDDKDSGWSRRPTIMCKNRAALARYLDKQIKLDTRTSLAPNLDMAKLARTEEDYATAASSDAQWDKTPWLPKLSELDTATQEEKREKFIIKVDEMREERRLQYLAELGVDPELLDESDDDWLYDDSLTFRDLLRSEIDSEHPGVPESQWSASTYQQEILDQIPAIAQRYTAPKERKRMVRHIHSLYNKTPVSEDDITEIYPALAVRKASDAWDRGSDFMSQWMKQRANFDRDGTLPINTTAESCRRPPADPTESLDSRLSSMKMDLPTIQEYFDAADSQINHNNELNRRIQTYREQEQSKKAAAASTKSSGSESSSSSSSKGKSNRSGKSSRSSTGLTASDTASSVASSAEAASRRQRTTDTRSAGKRPDK